MWSPNPYAKPYPKKEGTIDLGIKKLKRLNPQLSGKEVREYKQRVWDEFNRRRS